LVGGGGETLWEAVGGGYVRGASGH
jgi:hypothetical protein